MSITHRSTILFIYLFFIYFWFVQGWWPNINIRSLELSDYNIELKITWREMVVAYLGYPPGFCLEGLRKST